MLWLRSATAMAAAVERFWASIELRRASYSFNVRAVSRIPARVASEEKSRVAAFARSGRISARVHGGRQIQRMLVCNCARVFDPFLHISERDQHHFGLHVEVEAIPDGC